MQPQASCQRTFQRARKTHSHMLRKAGWTMMIGWVSRELDVRSCKRVPLLGA